MTLTRGEVASWLLAEEHLLTALEFHTELMENGISLEPLNNYFLNPANFEVDPNSESLSPMPQISGQSTSSRSTTPSSVLHVPESNLSLKQQVLDLEHELLQSQDVVAQLRQQIEHLKKDVGDSVVSPRNTSTPTIAPTHTIIHTPTAIPTPKIATAAQAVYTGTRSNGVGRVSTNAISGLPRVHKGAINYIVHQYLIHSGNRETSITFADEAGDLDFDDWAAVGLSHEPPSLHVIFQNYCNNENSIISPSTIPSTLEESTANIGAFNHKASSFTETLDKDHMQNRHHCHGHGRPEDLQNGRSGSGRFNMSRPHSIGNDAAMSDLDTGVVVRRVRSETRFMTIEQELKLDLEHSRRGYDALKQTIAHLRTRNEELECMAAEATESGVNASGARTLNEDNDHEDMDMVMERMFSYKSSRQRPIAYRKAIETVAVYGAGKDRLSLEVIHIKKNNDDPVSVFGYCLPNIVPHVLVKKRDELIPALIVTIQRHKVHSVRDQLTNLLFNLMRRPNENQRRAITNGCTVLAERIGPLRVEAELLPQCWEQINHPHAERRVLVAETCGKLVRFVKPELRGSLVLSILIQLLDDTSDMVRQAAVKNMGLVVIYLENKDKLNTLTSLVLKAILDRNDRVVRAAEALLLPSVAQWACELGVFCTSFLPTISSALENAMSSMNESIKYHNTVLGGNQYGQRQIRQQQSLDNVDAASRIKNVLMHMEAMTLLVPFLYAYVIRTSAFGTLTTDEPVNDHMGSSFSGTKTKLGSASTTVLEEEAFEEALNTEPSWLDAMEDDDFWRDMDGDTDTVDPGKTDIEESSVLTRQPSFTKHAENVLFALTTLLGQDSVQARLQMKLNEQVSRNQYYKPGDAIYVWPAFDWLREEWLGRLVTMASDCPLENENVTFALSRLIFVTCATFGDVFTRNLIQPLFLKVMSLDPRDAKGAGTTSLEVRSARARVCVAYFCGVLRALSLKDERIRLLSEFKKIMVDIASGRNGWTVNDFPLLEIIVRMLCKSDESLTTDVVVLMWDLIVNPDASIRASSPFLVQGLLTCCDIPTLRERVLPALITLSSDENMEVRLSAIPVFGQILESVDDGAVQDKIKMQLESLLESDDIYALKLHHEIISMLANIMPTIHVKFRDDFIVPRLADIAVRLQKYPDDPLVSTIVSTLVNTIIEAMQCDISLVLIQRYIQPACETLQRLPRTCVHLEDEESVHEILNECTERLSSANLAAHALSESMANTRLKLTNFFNKGKDDPNERVNAGADSGGEVTGMHGLTNRKGVPSPPSTPVTSTNAFTNLFKGRN
eukprot:CFRG6747T1